MHKKLFLIPDESIESQSSQKIKDAISYVTDKIKAITHDTETELSRFDPLSIYFQPLEYSYLDDISTTSIECSNNPHFTYNNTRKIDFIEREKKLLLEKQAQVKPSFLATTSLNLSSRNSLTSHISTTSKSVTDRLSLSQRTSTHSSTVPSMSGRLSSSRASTQPMSLEQVYI